MKKKFKALRKPSKFIKWVKRSIWTLLILIGFVAAFAMYSFSHFLTLATDVPYLIGFPFDAKNYLIVAQNDAELRPSGGFATAYVLLQFRSGDLENMEFHDVYGAIDDHDFVEPPYPYGELLAHEFYSGHTFRDANVYADFPSSAEELIKFFNINKPEVQIDGVITINFSLFEDVVGVLGEINADGTIYNQNNLFEKLEHKLNNIDRHNIEQIYSRKQFLQPILYATIKKALKNPHKWRDLSTVTYEALNNKDVQLYFKDSSLQNKYTKRGWTSVWLAEKDEMISRDFFAVVESNLGGMKSNRYITRDVSYDLYLDENFDARAKASVEITHNGVQNIPLSGDYTSFVRVYAPLGAKLKNKLDTDLEYEDSKRAVFGKKVALKPGESTILDFEYTLPEGLISQNNYQLYIPKQAATKDFYTVTIHAPQGLGLDSGDFETRENIATFRGFLNSDQLMNLQILPDELSPLIIFQKMTSLNTATIHFNEEVTMQEALIEIIDLNFINEQKDELLVTEVSVDPDNRRIVNIQFEGLTEAPEERYKVRISGIADKHGNMINPEPTEITIIQRNL